MLKNRLLIWTLGILSSFTFQTHFSLAQDNSVEAEIQRLKQILPEFKPHPIDLNTSGEMLIPDSCCLRIDKLRGIQIDAKPPRLRAYPKHESKHNVGRLQGPVPYIAPGIRPFRLNHFDCEFVYGGRHNGQMRDYASTHGFSTIYPYYKPKDTNNQHYPAGTSLIRTFGFNWDKWMKENRVPSKRYDLLANANLELLLLRQKAIPAPSSGQPKKIMLDMEHTPLSLSKLRKQPWYPKPVGGQRNNENFEKTYYQGFAKTLSAAVNAAHRLGWQEVSIYGWSPFDRTWSDISKIKNERPNLYWTMFGQDILSSVDKVNCSVYCFYWNRKNVSYTLANIDENLNLMATSPTSKPLRPYFWGLLHGGGPGYRSWEELPLPNEEQRAMLTAAFFTGVDGIVYWNSSGYSNHHVPDFSDFRGKTKSKRSLMVKSPFSMAKQPPDTGQDIFGRYTALNVIEHNAQNDVIQFQRIGLQERNLAEAIKKQPVYSTSFEMMKPFLRPRSEPVAAAVEALALVKPVERALKNGKVVIDVPAKQQFTKQLPIIRRVINGKYHFVFTYDPSVVHGGEPRDIALSDFESKKGLNLKFKADADSRIYILKEAG